MNELFILIGEIKHLRKELLKVIEENSKRKPEFAIGEDKKKTNITERENWEREKAVRGKLKSKLHTYEVLQQADEIG